MVNTVLNYEVAQERRKDFERDAARARAVASVRDGQAVSRFAAGRRQIGAMIVRAGERMQGANRPEVIKENLPTAADLRMAR
jgi:hypothetical protein